MKELSENGRTPCIDHAQQSVENPNESSQVDPRHTSISAYRCFLPDLTGFTPACCMGPGYQLPPDSTAPYQAVAATGNSIPHKRISGYRAPLPPHLVRPGRRPGRVQISFPGPGRLLVAEREGFEPSRPLLAAYTISNRAPSANSDISPVARPRLASTDVGVRFIEPSEGVMNVAPTSLIYLLAERVGFEPTWGLLAPKPLSRRPRYDHFGTSP